MTDRTDEASGRAPRWKLRVVCLIVAAWLAAGLVGVAGAQEPGELIPPEPGEEAVDTDVTPVAKPTEMWQLVHGTRYERTEPVDGSLTSFDVDLYAVAFRNERLGYAGGSRCVQPPQRQPDDSDGTYGERVSACEGSERVPVMYRFTDTADFGEVWEAVDLQGDGKPGFVGEIAWIDSERALAVGGDGRYPRREVGRESGESLDEWERRDPAGSGRAWLLEDGSWRELDVSGLRTGAGERMRGMTALAVGPSGTAELGVAGALGQVWHWKGGFTEGFDRHSSAEGMFNAHLFTGRVRDLEFGSGSQVFGVTAGCCREDEVQNIPRLLAFHGGQERWYVRGWLAPLDQGEEHVDAAPELPDSLYALAVSGSSVRVLGTPGGPRSEGEPASAISDPYTFASDGRHTGPNTLTNSRHDRLLLALATREWSTLRLVDADAEGSDFRWLVGELGSTTLQGLGAQAVARAEHLEPYEGADVCREFEDAVIVTEMAEALGTCASEPRVEGEDRALHPLRPRVYRLPSYSLHGLDVVGDSGVGWAVGDRGALVRLSEQEDEGAAAASEPSAPRVGRPRESELSDRSPFDGFRPIAEDVEAGAVPPFYAQPREQAKERRFEWAGPSPVDRIVMSRDHTEGWASGSGGMFRLADGHWQRCEVEDSDRGPADPACKELGGSSGPMVRLPTERGDDPSRQDEFEVIARRAGAGFFRYRDGRWARWEPEGAGGVQVRKGMAFTAPDDGWAFDHQGTFPTSAYRFDGERWIRCPEPGGEECGDREGRLALGESATTAAAIFSPVPSGPRVVINGAVPVGERLYVFGHRMVDGNGQRYPLVLYKDPGGQWTSDGGGFDPAWEGAPPDPSEWGGRVLSLAVAEREDGEYEGWAIGRFGEEQLLQDGLFPVEVRPPNTTLMRLQDGEWEMVSDEGPAGDYLPGASIDPTWHVAMAQEDGSVDSFFSADGGLGPTGGRRLFGLQQDSGRFELLDVGRPPDVQSGAPGGARALAPDGEGGFWASAGALFRYTDRPRLPVFGEVPSPVTDGRIVNDIAGSRDGSVWLTTRSDILYRYDRLTGWDRVRVPGWDPGAVVTSPSAAHAVAVGPDGSGVVVGAGGRIARVGPGGAVLDRAAGRACDLAEPRPPCSTGRDLRDVDVAPDGSAIAVGDRLALLWRPGGGEFRSVARPRAAARTNITGVSMPRADRAWLTTSTGRVFRGALADGEWSWVSEAEDGSGDQLSGEAALSDVAVDASGRGYAVGGGNVLERTGDGQRPWRRSHREAAGVSSVALPVGGGPGALFGGSNGLVLSLVGDRLEVANPPGGGLTADVGSVAGLAMLPGVEAGQTEAWVALGGSSGTNQLLHYSSDPEEVLLRPDGRVDPLPDAPAPRPGEVTVAALGKSECDLHADNFQCMPMQGTSELSEVITRRAIAEVAERSVREGGGVFSVFTGDAVDAASGREDITGDMEDKRRTANRATAVMGPMKLRRWRELVADRADRAGVPMLGALGGQDLAEAQVRDPAVTTLNVATRDTKTGDNLAWREAFAGRRGPWGDGSDPELAGGSDVSFRAVRGSDLEVEGEGPLDGAATHYAMDALRGGEPVLRVVFADTSLRSMSTSEGAQQPLEPAGGQAAWLERVLCRRPGRAPTGEACTRRADLPAVVVTNTPTYSYGPGAGVETMTDAAAFEAILMRHRVSAAVAGRLGWNARYWATAPGLHEPCPGGSYQDEPPEPGAGACGEGTQGIEDGSVPEPEAPEQAGLVADALSDAGAPAPPEAGPSGIDPEQLVDPAGAGAPVSLLPFVVASGAGSPEASAGQARDGFWHGYSIVRVPADGDPRGVIVEQRPIYDYLTITAQERRLRPGQRVRLRGYGRGPIGTRTRFSGSRAHFDRIDSDAITHRYDLLEADPERPYLPREDASGEYVPLDPEIATVDRQTGEVRAGRGDHERAYAIAVLSVGDNAASYPMVFEPRRSFRAVREQPEPAPLPTPQPPAPVPQVAGVPAAPPPPPPPPPPAPPPPGVSTPAFPALPALPSLSAPPAIGPPPAPTPPPTPPLPTPPTFSQAAPLGIAAEVGAIGVQGSVVPPSPPPVNPAPPGGSAARKEAKQRQAATAKSEEGEGGEGHMAEETQQAGGDMANQPLNAATRHEHPATAIARDRPVPSFTPLERADNATEARALAYAGGLTLAALALALGWSTLRPTPRRRHPPQAAPAWARRRSGPG